MSFETKRVWTVVLSVLVMCGCFRNPTRLVESGKKYIAEAKYNDAVIELRNAIKVNPQLAEAHYQLSLAYLHLGSTAEANQEVDRTIVLQPGNRTAQLLHGNLLLLMDRNFQDAKTTAETILQ